MTDDDQLGRRMQTVLQDAIAGLDPTDLAERIAWCQETGEHRTRAHFDEGKMVRFTWGGRDLALVHTEVLTEDGGPVAREFIADVVTPDTVPPEWVDGTDEI